MNVKTISSSDYKKLKILTDKRRFRILKAVWKYGPEIPLRTLAEKLRMDFKLVAFDVAIMVDYGVLRDSGKGKNARLSIPQETRNLLEAVEKSP